MLAWFLFQEKTA